MALLPKWLSGLFARKPAASAPPPTVVPTEPTFPGGTADPAEVPFATDTADEPTDEDILKDLDREGLSGMSEDDRRWLLAGEWQQMASSNVEAIRYLYQDHLLEVEFKNGSFYQYMQVPAQVALAFSKASSPGRFVWGFLRGVYPYAKLTGPSTVKPRQPYPSDATVIRIRRDLEADPRAGILPGGDPLQHPEDILPRP